MKKVLLFAYSSRQSGRSDRLRNTHERDAQPTDDIGSEGKKAYPTIAKQGQNTGLNA